MKDAHEAKRLWGWSDPAEETQYVGRVKALLEDKELAGMHSFSNIIKYPEYGLVCVQTEMWVKVGEADGNALVIPSRKREVVD